MTGSLSACSSAPPETRAAYEPVTDATATARPLAVLPAEAGAIISVLESRVSGIFTQRIVLSGDTGMDGENVVIVQIDQTDRSVADLSVLPKPTQDSISRELDTNFPSTDMQISNAWSHNEFGPFGYAVGKGRGDVTCIYAWQFTQGAPVLLIDDPAKRSAAASMPSSPTAIRVRLCRHGLSEAELVSLVKAMQVYPLGGGAPFHDALYAGIGPQAAGDALQAAGAPGDFFLRPKAAHDPVERRGGSKPRHRVVAHHRTQRYRAAPMAMQPVVSRPVAGSVVVPLPSGASAPTAGVSNPLLAPLQSAPPPRAVSNAGSDDMPLPGAAGASSLAAPPAPRSGATVPLPN